MLHLNCVPLNLRIGNGNARQGYVEICLKDLPRKPAKAMTIVGKRKEQQESGEDA